MPLIKREDREYIENKYHRKSEPFSPYDFRHYHGGNYDEATGLKDEEMKKGLKEIAKAYSARTHALSKAKQIEFVLDNTPVSVNGNDWFAGVYSWTRLIVPTTSEVWQAEIYSSIPSVKSDIDDFRSLNIATVYPDYDHSLPDWDAIMSLGFKGLYERVKKYHAIHEEMGCSIDTKERFEAMECVYQAILRLIARLAEQAQTTPSEKSERQYECFIALTKGAPQDTYQALQLIYLYHLICECIDCYQVRSLASGLDRTLTPFFRNDIKSGRRTRAELDEILAHFLLQYASMDNYWGQPAYLGGSNERGECIVNEVSHEILSVYDELGVYNPKLQIKLTATTPISFLNKALDMIRRRKGSIVFVGETGTIKAMESYGVSREDALTCDVSGCYEIHAKGNEIVTLGAYFNLVQPLLFVLDEFSSPRVRKLLGVNTAPLSQLTDFEKLISAYEKVLSLSLNKATLTLNEVEKYLGDINPSITFTATVENALSLGVDGYQEGVKHNNTGVFCCAFATAVDSLCVIKELVYDKKLITLRELSQALKNEWQGYEKLRSIVKSSPFKYGNNHPEADKIAKRIYDKVVSLTSRKPNSRGGVYKTLMHTALYYLHYGESTPATPDGRIKGEEVSKNASPSVGADKRGATALMLSALSLKPYLCSEDFCVDIMLHPSACEGEDGLVAMRSLLSVYEKQGGLAIQFNVASADILRDAQKHPDRYPNLQVRVCGWNVLWSNMNKAEQDAYIARAENL